MYELIILLSMHPIISLSAEDEGNCICFCHIPVEYEQKPYDPCIQVT
jgi:hypothetical protein